MREPARKFTGRVEYLACRPEVAAMLEQGHSVRMIYDSLKKQGKITIHYGTFWRYACMAGISHKPLLPANKRRKAADAPEQTAIGPGLDTLPALHQGGADPVDMLPALQGDVEDFTPSIFRHDVTK